MLSIMNEIDPCLLLLLCVLYGIQNQIFLQCCPNSPFLEHAQSLTCIPQPDEIYRTLRDLPPLKAPRPDGYHTLFFQSNWLSLGPSIIQVIKEVFE